MKIDFDYPFFIEKTTPVSKQKNLVRYLCTYSVKASSIEDEPKVFFKMEVPAISTYPASDPEKPGGLFGQEFLDPVRKQPAFIARRCGISARHHQVPRG